MPPVPGSGNRSGIINGPDTTSPDTGYSKGKGAAGAPDTTVRTGADFTSQNAGKGGGMSSTFGFDASIGNAADKRVNKGAPGDGKDKGGGQGAGSPAAIDSALAASDKSQHPNVNGPGGSQKWVQDKDGNWTQTQAFDPSQQSRWNNYDAQSVKDSASPLGTGDQARDQAINAAYGQATSRLNPQWDQNSAQMQSQLASQGLDPNSQAYRTAMQNLSQSKNDAYSSAMNSAIGQGTAAQQATFGENLAQKQFAGNQMQQMQGLLPSNSGSNSQAILAAQLAQQKAYNDQQITADYVGSGMQAASTIAGGAAKSDARVKNDIVQFPFNMAAGVPYSEWAYKDDPSGQRYGGVIAQDLEGAGLGHHVQEDGQGVKHVSEQFAPKPVGDAPGAAPAQAPQAAQPIQAAQSKAISDENPLSGMSDEQVQKLVRLGVIPEEQAGLARQMAQAHALQQSNMSMGHRTGIAAALGGVGDIFNSVRGGLQEKDVLSKEAGLRGEQVAGRSDYYKLAQQQAQANALKRPPGGLDAGAAYVPGDE